MRNLGQKMCLVQLNGILHTYIFLEIMDLEILLKNLNFWRDISRIQIFEGCMLNKEEFKGIYHKRILLWWDWANHLLLMLRYHIGYKFIQKIKLMIFGSVIVYTATSNIELFFDIKSYEFLIVLFNHLGGNSTFV